LLWAALVALPVVTLAACYEEPIEEKLCMCFLPDGSPAVAASVRINTVPGEERNPALQRRVADMRWQIEHGDDPWRARFALLEAEAERSLQDRISKQFVEARRYAAGIEPEALGRFFSQFGASVSYEMRDGLGELNIVAGAPSRANAEQRRRVAEALQRWSELMARHLERVGTYKAIVALARKLAVVMHAMWVRGEAFRPFREVVDIAA